LDELVTVGRKGPITERIARGKVVVVEQHFRVKITEIIP